MRLVTLLVTMEVSFFSILIFSYLLFFTIDLAQFVVDAGAVPLTVLCLQEPEVRVIHALVLLRTLSAFTNLFPLRYIYFIRLSTTVHTSYF